MFEHLQPLPPDPLLRIMAAYAGDTNPRKVDLGVGVYKDEAGTTPVFPSVKAAEAKLIEAQDTKAYIGPEGSPLFNRLVPRLIFGEKAAVLEEGRVATVQTPAGCGALRVAADLVQHTLPGATVWCSDPTWDNHLSLLGDAGVKLAHYPYYHQGEARIQFDRMMATLEQVPAGDAVLLHGACHNPSGADLTREQWQAVAELAQKRGFLPFIDLAYQGFGEGIHEDAYGPRLLAESVPELIVASSCSKNFGLYRERTGSLNVVTGTAEQAEAALTHVNRLVRGIYSMPPAHGAAIVETLLSDAPLQQQWWEEVTQVRRRIQGLRRDLADALQKRLGEDRFRFIEHQRGMFSFLGIGPEKVDELRERFSIYAAGSSRINVAGLGADNLDYVADAIAAVISDQ